MRKVLNVGGNSKAIPLPAPYEGWEHVLLDIDPAGQPDIVCDARTLQQLEPAQFDAVYCSHNLEHYHAHEVAQVLRGFLHVLKPGGLAHIRVPDIGEVMRTVVERGLDVEDELYQSGMGPIKVLDVLYGLGAQIERTGEPFFAHKTGFTPKSLTSAVLSAGFHQALVGSGALEVVCIATAGEPDPDLMRCFGLLPEPSGTVH